MGANRRPAAPPLAGRRVILPLLLAVIVACGGGAVVTTAPPSQPVVLPTTNSTAAPTAPPSFPVSLTDDEGTVVEIPAAPQTIVSLTPAATEILFAIGAGPRVVAKVEDLANFPPEASSVPVVATFQGVDVEKIVAAEADLVVSGGAPFGQGPAVEQLRRANIPVLVVAPATLADVLDNIQLIGSATGDGVSAKALADTMTADFDAIRAATAGLDHPKVFYEIDATSKIFTAATGSLLEEMLKIAGADPITTGSATAYDIAIETLVQADPQLILLGDAAYGVTPEQVKARPGWNSISAVKSGNIKAVDDIVITRPGPRLVEGLRTLALAIHPDLVLPPPASPQPSAQG
ncbi:MAG TPA: ABC transporter substrate-binding protein [Candidatus Eisenbacteria bacterium]|nr:ABC transporter substrate-binding protein [Candidatus Eisenbacteria bacterium]